MLRRAQGLRVIGRSTSIASDKSSIAPLSRSLQKLGLYDTPNSTYVNRAVGKSSPQPSRTYATTTAAKPRRSAKAAVESDTSDAPSSARVKRGSRTSTGSRKKATTKKKVAKPKKKVVAKKKKKPVKKELTPEAKAKKDALAQRKKLRDLKEKALLKEEPKAGLKSAWNVFFTEFQHEGGDVAARAKACASAFKSLSSSEIEQLNHKAVLSRQAAQRAYDNWVSKYSPNVIRDANDARRYLKRKSPPTKTGRRPAFSLIKDDRLPKRPTNAYAMFVTDRNSSGDFKNIAIIERSKLISEEWRSLSADEKQRFSDLAEADLQRYAREHLQAYGTPVGTQSSGATEA